MNQCDGCQAGLPLENGMHIDKAPGGKFMCTKEEYEQPSFPDNMERFREKRSEMNDMDKFCLAMYLWIWNMRERPSKAWFQQFRLWYYMCEGWTPSYMWDLDDILVFDPPTDEV